MGSPKTTKEQRQSIIQREASGEFQSVLASEYGLTVKYVSMLINHTKRGIR
jgi:hypothetical protein